ncbi:hypothetical protein TRIUR3_05485 [Triticum urartu]|uniref:Uncharacterized protein n=1 Tax=Triticum urartu TaxID=4572 RepID=M7Y7Y2_TRIUA|nr:hypothetical protein TRIUR3_05485 [Triticum urartu]
MVCAIDLMTEDRCNKNRRTTYENFRYRADSRPNVYDRGCLNNFLEVLCSKGKPSKHRFRAYVQEEVRAPVVNFGRQMEEEPAGGPRAKVEDDLEIGSDLLKISRRRNYEDVDVEMGNQDDEDDLEIGSDLLKISRRRNYEDGDVEMGSQDDGETEGTGGPKLAAGSGSQIPAVGSEVRVRHSSWDRRSGNWDMSSDMIGRSASDVLGRSASLTEAGPRSQR